MACPDCSSSAGDFRIVTSVETHGLDCGPYETFNEEFIVCRECGGRIDLRDWEGTPEIVLSPGQFAGDSTEPKVLGRSAQHDCSITNLPAHAR